MDDLRSGRYCVILRQSGPGGMLSADDEAFRVRHQAEHLPGRVADASDVSDGAVGVVTGVILQSNLPLFIELGQDATITCDESSFAMRDGEFKIRQALRPDTAGVVWHAEFHPAVDESAGVIVCQCAALLAQCFGGDGREQPHLDQHLKAVADAEDKRAVVDGLAESFEQVAFHAVGEDAAGRNVIPITEPAGQRDNVSQEQPIRLAYQGIDMDQLRRTACLLEGEGQLTVAIRASGSD